MVGTAANFGGSIPDYYDSIMGPAQFEPFGADLAQRLPAKPPGKVLEIAAGTGRVTRHLRERLEPSVGLVATDISGAMLELARKRLGAAAVEWREADACKLPFDDAEFGAVVCAFGMMFVPDKAAALREARRCLRPGGILLFNTWDGLENNAHGRVAADVVETLLPGDPIGRAGSMPYQFNDRAAIAGLLAAAGFGEARMEAVRLSCTCPSARLFATGQLRGTPRSLLLEQKGLNLDEVIAKVGAALARIGGAEPFNYVAQALVVEARAA